MSRYKQIAVFIQGGLGDALLFTPLLRHLQTQGAEVHAFSRGFGEVIKAFVENGLIQGATIANNGKDLLTRAMFQSGDFDVAIINPFGTGKANFTLALSMAKNIYCNGAVPFIAQAKTLVRPPIYGVHDAIQNKLLWDPRLPLTLKLEEMELEMDFADPLDVNLPENYIALQISAGNNQIRYKNWPLSNWKALLDRPEMKGHHFVILGDDNETELAASLAEGRNNVTSLCGQTSIAQAQLVLKDALCLLGLDGGLLHLAVSAGTPTFTLWGPSDPKLYGYSQFSPRHGMIQHRLDHELVSWQNKNTTSLDPDTNHPGWWMGKLSVDQVARAFAAYYEQQIQGPS